MTSHPGYYSTASSRPRLIATSEHPARRPRICLQYCSDKLLIRHTGSQTKRHNEDILGTLRGRYGHHQLAAAYRHNKRPGYSWAACLQEFAAAVERLAHRALVGSHVDFIQGEAAHEFVKGDRTLNWSSTSSRAVTGSSTRPSTRPWSWRWRKKQPEHKQGCGKWLEPRWESGRQQPNAAGIEDPYASSVGTLVTSRETVGRGPPKRSTRNRDAEWWCQQCDAYVASRVTRTSNGFLIHQQHVGAPFERIAVRPSWGEGAGTDTCRLPWTASPSGLRYTPSVTKRHR
jgi:hypothetical protein